MDGFRLDIFNAIYKDQDLKDNPFTLRLLPDLGMTKVGFQERKHTINLPESFELARELRSLIDEFDNPSRFLVGEVFGTHQTLHKFLGKNNDGLNLIFLFDITHFQFEAEFFRNKIRTIEAFYPYPYTPTYVFSNHDIARSLSRLDQDPAKAKLLVLMQMTLRGTTFTYQGEEIGMVSGTIPVAEALDPLAAEFDWMPESLIELMGLFLNRDNCRTPMQWDGEPNAGFTSNSAIPWLPVPENAISINVLSQQENPNSILNAYQALLKMRNEAMPLKWGSLEIIEVDIPDDVLAYRRDYGGTTFEVYINFSQEKQQLPAHGKVVFSIGIIANQDDGIELNELAGCVIEIN